MQFKKCILKIIDMILYIIYLPIELKITVKVKTKEKAIHIFSKEDF